MAEVFRQQYTRPIPEGAERIQIKVKGKKKARPGVRFKDRSGRVVEAPLTKKGDRCRVESSVYYGNVRMPDGSISREKLCKNRAAALSMLSRLQADADTAKATGVPVERLATRARPLSEWLDEYETAVATGARRKARKNLPRPSREHVDKTMGRLRAVMVGCRFAYPADVSIKEVQAFLAGLELAEAVPDLPPGKDTFRPGELASLLGISMPAFAGMVIRHGLDLTGNGKARRMARGEAERLLSLASRGPSEKTVSYYAREARAFTAWLVRKGALAADPLADLPGATGASSHRHDRRAMEEDEIGKLLDATKTSKKGFRGLDGEDRYFLYLVALSTGFRASELASLTPGAFRLDDAPPVVLLGQQASKNGEGASQPLSSAVVPLLRPWLDGKPSRLPLWPGKWAEEAADMLRADLRVAGVAHIVPGPDGELFLDFHGLRHSFIARLDRAGVPLKAASELARHSTVELTAKVYARPRLHDLAGQVNKLDFPQRPPADPAGKTAAG